MAFEAAAKHWRGVPPNSSHAAEAAMALAAPTSAWQPPSAPETVALRVMRYPMPAAFANASTICSSENSWMSWQARSMAGKTPDDPAVDAATMRPMEALVSRTAMA